MIVNIQQVNPPGPQSTGKFGHLITDSGKIYFPVDMMGEFRVGSTVDIRTKDQTWGATPVKVVASRPTAPVQGYQPQQGYQRPANNQAPYRSNTGFQPRVIEGGPVGLPAGDKDRHIFVCGVVQQAMSSGKFTASEILVLTQAANDAFDLIRPKPRPMQNTFPSDPLPPSMEADDPGPELQ